jgi:DNA helicase HerA-like ATPase
VRLIRSKGVGVVFVTQRPTDVPDGVLGQLGSRVQHQLRAATPNDAKALRATVSTYPTSSYDDLGKVILSLGIGEAVVTVMNERGAPTPVAWTRLRAPESLMGPAEPDQMTATVDASPLKPKYMEAVDRESAREKLAAKLDAGAEQARREPSEKVRQQSTGQESDERIGYPKGPPGTVKKPSHPGRPDSVVQDIMKSPVARDLVRTAAREIVRGVFGVGRRR